MDLGTGGLDRRNGGKWYSEWIYEVPRGVRFSLGRVCQSPGSRPYRRYPFTETILGAPDQFMDFRWELGDAWDFAARWELQQRAEGTRHRGTLSGQFTRAYVGAAVVNDWFRFAGLLAAGFSPPLDQYELMEAKRRTPCCHQISWRGKRGSIAISESPGQRFGIFAGLNGNIAKKSHDPLTELLLDALFQGSPRHEEFWVTGKSTLRKRFDRTSTPFGILPGHVDGGAAQVPRGARLRPISVRNWKIFKAFSGGGRGGGSFPPSITISKKREE